MDILSAASLLGLSILSQEKNVSVDISKIRHEFILLIIEFIF
jgi:hypothetical protein